ncbi:MAG: hypothetical protein DRI95_11695 [Bacteroidetes bacterium]|nr:MAG: hypothetical protein DRI95_11695 [Bacteroidota bacterium]
MKKKIGDKVTPIILPAIDGTEFSLNSLNGKRYMISFLRFASCPFCNLRVNQLVSGFDQFGNNFTIIAIFDSPLDNLQKHVGKHKAPFPILADHKNTYYKAYGIEHSFLGMLKGMIGRFPTLMRGILKGYIPIIFKGSLITMPADILVDENGIIQTAYYGTDEGDHLDFEKVKAFALGA